MTTLASSAQWVNAAELAGRVAGAVEAGGRFVGLLASPAPGEAILLRVIIDRGGELVMFASRLPAELPRYPSLTAVVPAAFWYEREVHDLYGLVPEGHPRLDPLVFPLAGDEAGGPRPGLSDPAEQVQPDTSSLAGHVEGEGVFTIPYGPVRSGVFEAVEYLVETFGEDIPRVRVRPYVKHRGIARRFDGMTPDQAVLLAERYEGTMSVAHACALCQAVEQLSGVEPPAAAQYQRLLFAEVERIANHLDSMVRHTEGAGQAVAHARLAWEKERVLRFQAGLTGHRFARGAVVPGGTSGAINMEAAGARRELALIWSDTARDLRSLMTTPSFLDRLRNTGLIPPPDASAHSAVGPVGRGSGAGPDTRIERAYGAYPWLKMAPVEPRDSGDALARQWVRVEEITTAFDLAGQALERLEDLAEGPWSVPVVVADGTAIGSVESPQGELVYVLDAEARRLVNVRARTASFHNFALFSSAFRGDIFTDYVFIEASFGVNMAGVAG